jgi:hypothetical protein
MERLAREIEVQLGAVIGALGARGPVAAVRDLLTIRRGAT